MAKNELDNLLNIEDIKKRPVPIIFFANKMDLKGSSSPQEISDHLNL